MPAVTITLPDIPVGVDPAEMARAIANRLAAGAQLADLHAAWTAEVMRRLADTISGQPGFDQTPCPAPQPSGTHTAGIRTRLAVASDMAAHGRALTERATALCAKALADIPAGTDLAGITRTEGGWEIGGCPLEDGWVEARWLAGDLTLSDDSLPAVQAAREIDETPSSSDRDANVLARRLADALDRLADQVDAAPADEPPPARREIPLPTEPWHDGTRWKTACVVVEYRIRVPRDWDLGGIQVSRSLDTPPLHYSTGTPAPGGGQGTFRSGDVMELPFLSFRYLIRPEWRRLGEAFDLGADVPEQVPADRDTNRLARQLADALDELATEKAAHEETRDALSVANDHRTVLGVVADAARTLVPLYSQAEPPHGQGTRILSALSALETALDDLDMEENQ